MTTATGDEAYCYLTTTGRVTGRPHTIEIWFALVGRTVLLMAGGGDGADWVQNLRADPHVTVRFGREDADELPGVARLVASPSEEDALARRLLPAKYAPEYSGDLGGWARSALVVTVDLAAPA